MLKTNLQSHKIREMKMTMAKSLCDQAMQFEREDNLKEAIHLYENAHRYCIECQKSHPTLTDSEELMASIPFIWPTVIGKKQISRRLYTIVR